MTRFGTKPGSGWRGVARRALVLVLLIASAPAARANHELIFLSGMEGCALAFPDVDGDTFGDELRATDNCARPVSYIAEGGDCDDGNGAIKPGVPDAPDALFRDDNCDGIDGDIARAAFVSPTAGANAGTCGIKAPCATIGFALRAGRKSLIHRRDRILNPSCLLQRWRENDGWSGGATTPMGPPIVRPPTRSRGCWMATPPVDTPPPPPWCSTCGRPWPLLGRCP